MNWLIKLELKGFQILMDLQGSVKPIYLCFVFSPHTNWASVLKITPKLFNAHICDREETVTAAAK